jgi:hypothetical protein
MGHQVARICMVEAIANAEDASSNLLRHLTRPKAVEPTATAAETEPAPRPTDLSAMIAAARRMIAAR